MFCKPNSNGYCSVCGTKILFEKQLCVRRTLASESESEEPPNTSVVGRVSVVRPVERGEGPCDRCSEKDANGLCEPARKVMAERTTCRCPPPEYRIRNLMGMVNCEITKCPKQSG